MTRYVIDIPDDDPTVIGTVAFAEQNEGGFAALLQRIVGNSIGGGPYERFAVTSEVERSTIGDFYFHACEAIVVEMKRYDKAYQETGDDGALVSLIAWRAARKLMDQVMNKLAAAGECVDADDEYEEGDPRHCARCEAESHLPPIEGLNAHLAPDFPRDPHTDRDR